MRGIKINHSRTQALFVSGSAHLGLLIVLQVMGDPSRETLKMPVGPTELVFLSEAQGVRKSQDSGPVLRKVAKSVKKPVVISPQPKQNAPPDLFDSSGDVSRQSDSDEEHKEQDWNGSSELASGLSSGGPGRLAETAEERYIAELLQVLNKKRRYPEMARRLRQQGRVLLRFEVLRNGQVLEARVVEESAYESLNRSAQSMIREMQELKPFPDEIKKNRWSFVIPVEFKM